MAFRMSRFVCNAATTAAAATVENIDELCIGFVYEGEKIPQFSSTFFNAHCHFFLLRNSETKAIKSAKKESERKKNCHRRRQRMQFHTMELWWWLDVPFSLYFGMLKTMQHKKIIRFCDKPHFFFGGGCCCCCCCVCVCDAKR